MAFIKLHKKNFFYNLDTLVTKLKQKDRLAIVLKDNAYGHGLEQIAKMSKEYGLQKVVVRDEDEALKVDNLFPFILILAPKNYKYQKFHYVINSIKDINQIPKHRIVHLKIDTGMHRHGVSIDEVEIALQKIKKHQLNLRGILTHFRSADELSSDFFWQNKKWVKVKQNVRIALKRYSYEKVIFHSANSPATLRLENYLDDFARCGISAYGYTTLNKEFNHQKLKPVLSLWADKILTKKIKKGEKIGYSGAYKANKEMIISTYDIGYGDGIFRYNGSARLYNAEKKPFLGKISMDSCCFESDTEKICIFNDAREFSLFFNTIPYEILTKLSPDIPKIIVD